MRFPLKLAEIKLRESSMNPERSERIEIPVLPLRDVVVYPHMVIPLFVGRNGTRQKNPAGGSERGIDG
jgi:ATP-dependent Lon protease